MNKRIKFLTKRCFVLISGCFLIASASAQQTREAFIEKETKPQEEKGWIDFRESNTLNPQTLFLEHGDKFGLTTQDEMRQFRMNTDDIGHTHFRFQQYHKGLKIVGAETILHHNGLYLKSMNGDIAENLNLNIQPAISSESGLQLSKDALNAVAYVWENPEIAAKLSNMSNGEKNFEKPDGELVICRKNWNAEFTADNLILAYRFRMMVLPVDQSKDVYVDAITGDVIKQIPLATNCNNNTGNTTWYGNKSFNAGYYGWPNNAWLLESHCPGEATMRSLRGDPLLIYNYGDADGSWTDANGVNGYNQRAGVTTYWAIHKAYDYYKNYHARLSYDNANGQLDCFSEISGGLWISSAENASWNTVTHHMSFGADNTSSPTDDWNTLDIVGHEMTHGVHQWSIGNNYSGQPGALDESFADIFGECIEANAKGNALPDFLIGADKGTPIRYMSNPNIKFHADTYYGTFWVDPSDPFDNGGVHFNSGIQNFWFYLLVMGGSGTNDHGNNYSVASIGLNAARNIAYRNMDVYLTTSSGFVDAREGSLRAAQDLFGWCSNEMLQVAKAWYAVGVSIYSPDWNYTVPCGTVASGATYRGIDKLRTSNTCTTTLPSGSSAIFSSGFGGITFVPGFTATSGCAFTAAIDYCNEGAYNLRTTVSTESENVIQKISGLSGINILSVYPNPASDKVYVTFESVTDLSAFRINLTDVAGRNHAATLVETKTTANLSR
ncbi:MAG: M4 family metallopeptidase [Bacteroidetes bacterium]|nr:M4 family metallopeptidase [Bacteroidota bacterium]